MRCLGSFCQSFERLPWNMHVLLDLPFLSKYLPNTVVHCSTILRSSVLSFGIEGASVSLTWPWETNEHLFCAKGWIPLCTAWSAKIGGSWSQDK